MPFSTRFFDNKTNETLTPIPGMKAGYFKGEVDPTTLDRIAKLPKFSDHSDVTLGNKDLEVFEGAPRLPQDQGTVNVNPGNAIPMQSDAEGEAYRTAREDQAARQFKIDQAMAEIRALNDADKEAEGRLKQIGRFEINRQRQLAKDPFVTGATKKYALEVMKAVESEIAKKNERQAKKGELSRMVKQYQSVPARDPVSAVMEQRGKDAEAAENKARSQESADRAKTNFEQSQADRAAKESPDAKAKTQQKEIEELENDIVALTEDLDSGKYGTKAGEAIKRKQLSRKQDRLKELTAGQPRPAGAQTGTPQPTPTPTPQPNQDGGQEFDSIKLSQVAHMYANKRNVNINDSFSTLMDTAREAVRQKQAPDVNAALQRLLEVMESD